VKILFAIKRLASAVGGAERVLCSVCSELAKRGHEVSILTFDPPDDSPFYLLDSRVKRIDLSIGDSSRQTGLGEILLRMKALRRTVRAERPDIAVGFMHSMFVPLAFSLAGTGVPVLGSEHIVPEYYRTRYFQYLSLRLAATFLVNLTVLSESIRLCYPNGVRRRMVVMPNPVEMTSNVAKVGFEKKSFILLSVGRFDAQKDHATLIRSFSQIAHEFPKWHLKIVGEGLLRPELELLVQTLGLQARVTMPGVSSAIGMEYESAEAFVISSRYEAFGLVTAEAMSHGLPVIGFADCLGTNELIEAGRTGILVDPGDDRVGSLASDLSRLMTDPELRRRLGRAGRDAVNTRFSSQQVCDLWEKLLRSLIKSAFSPDNSQSGTP
jgi:glycosyltransferase involved in cell wall biosynthesis